MLCQSFLTVFNVQYQSIFVAIPTQCRKRNKLAVLTHLIHAMKKPGFVAFWVYCGKAECYCMCPNCFCFNFPLVQAEETNQEDLRSCYV